jgi:UDP-glucose 4-epimerase
MRIAVTGATGNVGTAVLRRLTADGRHQLTGLARRLPEEGAWPGVRWASVDLTESGAVDTLVGELAGVDAVVHLAWGFQPSHRLDYLEELGVGGTSRVLEAVTRAGVGHLVHMSSVGAYSPKVDDTPVDESWPTEGVPTSPYSTHKAAAERLLDTFEQEHPTTAVTRLRPGIIGQRDAGSALLRYGVPSVVPARALSWLPLLPLDRRLKIPMVHADDVAAAIDLALQSRAPGPFNLAAEPPVTAAAIGDVLSARPVHVPAPVVRAAAAAAWHARLQQVDPGWVDLGYAVPLMDCGRAQRELGWSPRAGALEVLAETVDGVLHAASQRTPVLRPRTVGRQLGTLLRRGPVSERRQP